MLWLVVRVGSDTPEPAATLDRVTETISGHTEVLFDSDRVSLVGEAPDATVKIHGERLSVWQAKMQVTKLRFVVDARNYGEGVHVSPVRVEGLPPGVAQEPSNVSIRLEANMRLTFKVSLVAEGNVDEAKLAGVRAEPDEVAIVGPASLLQQIKKVQVRVPSQTFEAPGSVQTVVVFAVNDKGRTVNVSIQPKTVDIVYQPVIERKEFSKLQPEIKGLAKGYKVLLPAEGVTVILEGTTVDLQAVKPEDIKIVLDVTGLAPGDYIREASVTLPKNVKLAADQPLRIPIKITPE
jgi:YbbR domain-containing protein